MQWRGQTRVLSGLSVLEGGEGGGWMAAKKLGGQRDWLGGRWWAMALGLGEGTTTQMWSPAAPLWKFARFQCR